MNDRMLINIAILLSFIGMFLLMGISQNVSLENVSISDLSNIKNDNTEVKLVGTVDKIIEGDKIMLIELVQPQKINVVVFKDGTLNITKGSKLEVKGTVTEFKGKKEIIAYEIISYNN